MVSRQRAAVSTDHHSRTPPPPPRPLLPIFQLHPFLSATVDLANIDVILVGDSVGMVQLGYDTTQPVTVDDMLLHAKAVRRGAKSSLLVGDMPFGSYEISQEQALTTAYRFVKEAGMDCVKLEVDLDLPPPPPPPPSRNHRHEYSHDHHQHHQSQGGRDRASTVQAIVKGGVAVMGHVGLTPQAISVIGGFRAQGRTGVKARALLDDALALQDAGACAVVLECVPAQVGKVISESLEIPTIGIGAGPHTHGQVCRAFQLSLSGQWRCSAHTL
mmetsp:Transcript_37815/g.103112  ORF Transcript_37815/g.103112 Transcript_37815/m.103112 type:complete len:272 (+) Transcript_37815:323-1138(+)